MSTETPNTPNLPAATSKPSAGRPSTYSLEVAVTICTRLAEGTALKTICRDEDMPSLSTVYRWLADPDHEAFREMYTRAREDQADTLADEILEIADDGRNDWMEIQTRGGGTIDVVDKEAVMRSQLRVDARKWIAAKLRPRKYSDKLLQEVTGKDGGPIQTRHADDLTDEQLADIARSGRPAPAKPAEGEG